MSTPKPAPTKSELVVKLALQRNIYLKEYKDLSILVDKLVETGYSWLDCYCVLISRMARWGGEYARNCGHDARRKIPHETTYSYIMGYAYRDGLNLSIGIAYRWEEPLSEVAAALGVPMPTRQSP